MSLLAKSLKRQIKNARKVVGLQLETKDSSRENQEEFADTIKNITEMVATQGELLIQSGQDFAELKKTNDERLKDLEKRGRNDPLDDDKLDRINEELNELKKVKDGLSHLKDDIEEVAKKMNRPGFGSGQTPEDEFQLKHKAGFEMYARKDDARALVDLDTKDSPMQISVPADGGFAVPEILDRQILKLMREDSPLRRMAQVVRISGPEFKKLVNKHGTSSGWVGETDPRTETEPSKLAEIIPTVGEIYAYPGTTQHALDDIYFDVEGFIRDEVYDEFADQESIAFVGGNGTKKPQGFLTAPMSAVPDKTRPFGTAEFKATGVAGGLSADSIIELPYRMKTKHRKRAVWLMNSPTMGKTRLLKTSQGDYIWQMGLKDGQPDKLNGIRVEGDENMPDVAANSTPIALGNWKRAYYIVDRTGVRFLRNPYNVVGYVYFYFTKRVGGAFVDTEAFKMLKCAA